jgi:hypothetical protein
MHNIKNKDHNLHMQCRQEDFLKITEVIEGMGLEIIYRSSKDTESYKFSEIEERIKTYYTQYCIEAVVYKEKEFLFYLSSFVNQEFVELSLPFEYVYEIYTRLDRHNYEAQDIHSSKLPLFYIENKEWTSDFIITLYRFRINARYLHNSEIKITYLFEYEPVLFKTGRVCSVVSSKDEDILNHITWQFLGFTELL